jgi:hypothetical protein
MFASTGSNVAASAVDYVQNVAYVGVDNHIYNLRFFRSGTSNPWTQWDITAFQQSINQGVPIPIAGYGMPAWAFPLASIPWVSTGNSGLIYFADSIGQTIIFAISTLPPGADVPNAFYLNQLTNTQNPLAGSQLAAYTWQKGLSMHVIYVDNQQDIVELYYNYPSGWYQWASNNLTAQTGMDYPKNGSALVGYAFENLGTENVFYIAQDNTIRWLCYSGGWSGYNLSLAWGAPAPAENSPLVGYACEYEDSLHVIYIANNGDIEEIYWSNDWNTNNLTQKTGAPQPAASSGLAGYSCEYEGTEHVIYVDNNSHLQEIYHSGNAWHRTDLTDSAGSSATAPIYGTPLAGYAFENERTEHVFYIDVDGNVHELYYAGTGWYTGVLSGSIPVSS